MAINIGTSPRGLPTPPAMLTPSESAGLCYSNEKKIRFFWKEKHRELQAYLKRSLNPYFMKTRIPVSSQFLSLYALHHFKKAERPEWMFILSGT